MKAFFLTFALLLAAVLAQGTAPASAAALGEAQLLAQLAGDDGSVVQVQGYGSYERGYGERPRRRYDDDGDDRGGYRDRRRSYSYGRGYCASCARRCSDGWCPPRCWGWRRECRRGRDRY